jgi:alpha/beta superfamily hydrolase
MTRGERIWIPNGGTLLEGLLWVPEGAAAAPGAVLCHPHPLRGGDMKNYVIAALWEALSCQGFAVIRFNFRGVGRSEGAYDEGVGEADDVLSALAFLGSRQGVDPARLAVAGYSFGAWTSSRAARRVPEVRALALVAPPLSAFPMDDVKSDTRPKLAIVGDRDEYCPSALFRAWFDGLSAPKEEAVVQGADHFFGGQEVSVAETTARFLAKVMKLPATVDKKP